MELEKAVHSMSPGPEKEELIKQLRLRKNLQQAYDSAERAFISNNLIFFIQVPVLLTKYDILKEISDSLLSLDINIMKLVFCCDNPSLSKMSAHALVQLPDTYRLRWNELNEKYSSEIKQLMKYRHGPTGYRYQIQAMPPESKNVPIERHFNKPTTFLPRKYELVFTNIFLHVAGHISAAYGLYLCFTVAKWQTIALACLWYILGHIGIVCGAHRLWSHRCYKAKMPLQIILMLFYCIEFQNTIINWVRNHRMHHKHSDTDGDPHNSSRGLFYSHIGWLCVRKHVETRNNVVDMSDIYSNPVLVFQKKYKIPLVGVLCYGLPTIIPMFYWGETLVTAFHVNMLRYFLSMNTVFAVNSVAHIFGNKPYDKSIRPTQCTLLSLLATGEGYHNYHHTFPWDYRAAELGNNYANLGKWFIDLSAMIGWAYDLKTVPDEIVQKRMKRTGDGSNCWGWGDKDMTGEERNSAKIIYPVKSFVTKEERDSIEMEEARDDIYKKIDMTKIFSQDYFRRD